MQEAIAVAGQWKYQLEKVVRVVEQGLTPYEVEMTYPKKIVPTPRLPVHLEVVVLREPKRGGEVALFADGSLVAFGMTSADLSRMAHELGPCRHDSDDVAWVGQPDTIHRRRYTTMADLAPLGFEVPPETTTSYIDEGALDAIVLSDATLGNKLPFMYCLSRRVQIDAVDSALRPIVTKVTAWRRSMGETGNLPMEVKDCRIGQARVMRLAAAQNRISARPRLLSDGDYANLRQMYGMTTDYFEVHQRSDALRERIATVTEGLRYLGNEAKARTDERLEWVIIILIAVEILVHLFEAAH